MQGRGRFASAGLIDWIGLHSRCAGKERACRSFPYDTARLTATASRVSFPHRPVLRPREGLELLLHTHDIAFSPEGRIGWATDVSRNAIDYAKPSAVHNAGGRDDRGVGTVINGALWAAGLMR